MNSIQKSVEEAVKSFRMGIIAQGSVALTLIVDAIIPLMEESASNITELDILIIKELLAAQERGDFNFVADILEYELPKSGLGKLLLG